MRFGGQCPLTMRHVLWKLSPILWAPRPVAMICSAYIFVGAAPYIPICNEIDKLQYKKGKDGGGPSLRGYFL